jgi:hypothetical protein
MNPARNTRIKIAVAALLIAALAGWGFAHWWSNRDRFRFDPSKAGAHQYDSDASYPGYNLYLGNLYDAAGKLVKKWSRTELGVIDTNGDYYAQNHINGKKWGRYTWDDQVIWEKNFSIHHEICLTPQGTVITFAKEVHDYQGKKNVEFDVILEFDKKGVRLSQYSTWEHLSELQKYHRPLKLSNKPTPRDPVVREAIRRNNVRGVYDYYHLNSLSIVPETPLTGTHPAFNPGNWLISMRHGSMLFILDAKTKKVLWRAIHKQVPGHLEGPHTPTMLPNGNILIFDNGRYRKWSRVIELDPMTLKVVWEYRAKGFYTETQGQAQKLPNGNVLVTVTEDGRAFEVTPDKRIVWEYYSPQALYQVFPQKTPEDEGVSKEYFYHDLLAGGEPGPKAAPGRHRPFYRMTRYPKDMIDRFLAKPAVTAAADAAAE